jgi:ferredoxin
MYKILRRFRVIFALLFLVALTLVFVDVSGEAAALLQPIVKWQFAPALLGVATGSAGILVCLLLLTVLMGRVYCSFLCPAGIFQDVVIAVANLFKSKKARRYSYAKPHRWLRYTIMTATVAMFVAGNAALLMWLDPYGNYGRMAENVFHPAVVSLNNAGASLFAETFYRMSYKTFTAGSIIAGTLFLVAVTVMSAWRGRLYCNTVCPVGSVLGLVARYSVFRIGIKKDTCTRCRLCELACKSQCVNVKEQKVDSSRCVQCYNCTTVCKFNSIGFRFSYLRKQKAAPPADPGRRRIFITSAGLLGAAAIVQAVAPRLRAAVKSTKAIAPPGACSIEHLKSRCTACHACVAKCPSQVIRPALGEYGLDGIMLPVMDYNNAFCNYTCTECSNICPTGALMPLTQDAKMATQIGKAHFNEDNCIVKLDGTDCGACDEHCPTKAVHMVDYRDGLLIPEVNTALCIGCGGCEYICPGRPSKAIYVVGNPVHKTADAPRVDMQEKVEADFGF